MDDGEFDRLTTALGSVCDNAAVLGDQAEKVKGAGADTLARAADELTGGRRQLERADLDLGCNRTA